jgi:hypothetical protein
VQESNRFEGQVRVRSEEEGGDPRGVPMILPPTRRGPRPGQVRLLLEDRLEDFQCLPRQNCVEQGQIFVVIIFVVVVG